MPISRTVTMQLRNAAPKFAWMIEVSVDDHGDKPEAVRSAVQKTGSKSFKAAT